LRAGIRDNACAKVFTSLIGEVPLTRSSPTMEFGRHISKGFWAFADKGLLAVYGVAFMLIVIRTLSPEEYGTFLLFQTIFLLINALATSFAVQPMMKYIAEGSDSRSSSSTALIITTLFIGVCTGLVLVFSRSITGLLDARHAQQLGDLLCYLPFLFVASVYKMIASGLLQARLCMKQLFVIDIVYYLASLILIILADLTGKLTSAGIVVLIMIVCSLLASAAAFLLSRPIAVPGWRWDKKEAGKIFNYGKYNLGSTVGNVAQTQFDTFLISMFSGVNGVAIYGAAKNFTRVFDMFTQSMQMLIIPASSMLRARNDEDGLTALVEKATCFGTLAILPVIIVYILFPGTIVWLIYGNKYAQSIPVLRVLALTGLVVPWGAVISSFLAGTGKTGVGFAVSIVSLVLSIGIFSLTGSIAGLYGISWGVVCVYGILAILGWFIMRRFVTFRLISILRRTKDAVQFIRNWKWPKRSVVNE
jgi:lipopolysaccharide exporter